jgi:GTP cyclohydrolase II
VNESYYYCSIVDHAKMNKDLGISPFLYYFSRHIYNNNNNNSCDCKEQLKMSLKYIQKHGGAIIYLQQEGRGIGLANKVAAYALQDVGLDTVDANLHLGFAEDCRQYGVVPSILADMGIGSIRLMTNNPRKVNRLIALGVDVVDTVPVVVPQANPYNRKYLETKIDRMEHSNLSPLFKNGMMVASSKTKTTATATNNNNQKESPSDEAEETTYVTDGEEMCANAVHISLMNNETMESSSSVTFATDTTTDNYDSQLGVTASEDGYCFGRQSVEDAVDAMAQGKMVVVVDDMDRENEGDFIMAADLCTPKDMATIIRYSSGVICIAMEGSRMDALQLPAMVTNNEDPKETAFSVSVDATKEHGMWMWM